MLYKFLEVWDANKSVYRFSLKSGISVFAILGIIPIPRVLTNRFAAVKNATYLKLWWCSELLVVQRYKLSRLLNRKIFRPLYMLVFMLYSSCVLILCVHLHKHL